MSLRELAEAATPGPWEVWTSNSYRRITQRGGQDGGVLSGEVQNDGHHDLRGNNREADLAYIAACSPERILALLDCIAAADAMRREEDFAMVAYDAARAKVQL